MEEKKNFIVSCLYYVLIFCLVYAFVKYLLPIIVPFVIGFLIAYIAVKMTKKLFKKDNKVIRIISTVIIYIIIVAVIALLLALGISKSVDFFVSIPNIYDRYIQPALMNLEQALISLNKNLPIDLKTDVNEMITDFGNSLSNLVTNFASKAVAFGTSFISNTTNILLVSIETIVSSFFFVLDYEKIFAYLVSLMNERTYKIYQEVEDYIQNTLLSVLKSYGSIMLITFLELFIGLLLIGIDNFGIVAMLISVLDILPILGVGTVLIPWGIICLLLGKTRTGILILVLYVVITAIRNVIEPKFVGAGLNIHPLVALASMMVGLRIFGGVGMFGLPLTISFFVKRNKIE